TVLLIGRSRVLIRTVRTAMSSFAPVHLEVCADHASGMAKARREGVILVLLEVTQETESNELRQLLRYLTTRDLPLATVSWGNACAKHRMPPLLRSCAGEHADLPPDLAKLGNLIKV